MKALSYKKLIRKITDNKISLNSQFNFYNYEITLLSGTFDYVNVIVRNDSIDYYLQFSFDFWTKKLVFYNYHIDILKILEYFKFFYGGNIPVCFDFIFEFDENKRYTKQELKLIELINNYTTSYEYKTKYFRKQ